MTFQIGDIVTMTEIYHRRGASKGAIEAITAQGWYQVFWEEDEQQIHPAARTCNLPPLIASPCGSQYIGGFQQPCPPKPVKQYHLVSEPPGQVTNHRVTPCCPDYCHFSHYSLDTRLLPNCCH